MSKNKSLEQIINEIQIQGTLEYIGDGVSIQDINYKILYQNKAHKKIVGEHIGEYCYKEYVKKEAVCEGCPMAKTFKDGKTHRAERTLSTDKGTSYFDITASTLNGTTGEIIAGIEIVKDITERKKMEKTQI